MQSFDLKFELLIFFGLFHLLFDFFALLDKFLEASLLVCCFFVWTFALDSVNLLFKIVCAAV